MWDASAKRLKHASHLDRFAIGGLDLGELVICGA